MTKVLPELQRFYGRAIVIITPVEMPIPDINRPLSIIIFVLYLSVYRVVLGRIYDEGLYLRFKPIVGVVNVYTMVPCHKTAAALGELYHK
jgi:hypothetical protein